MQRARQQLTKDQPRSKRTTARDPWNIPSNSDDYIEPSLPTSTTDMKPYQGATRHGQNLAGRGHYLGGRIQQTSETDSLVHHSSPDKQRTMPFHGTSPCSMGNPSGGGSPAAAPDSGGYSPPTQSNTRHELGLSTNDYCRPMNTKITPKRFEVDGIIANRSRGTRKEYLVLCKGLKLSDAIWEPLAHLDRCRKALEDYENADYKLVHQKKKEIEATNENSVTSTTN